MSARRVTACVTAVAVSLALLGCGSSDTTSTPKTTAPAAVDPAMKRLAGRYAHYDVVAYDSDGFKNLIISFGFTDLSIRGDKLWAHESFCHADQVTDQPVQTVISDAATSAIKPISIAVTLTTKNGKARIQRAETPTGIGIKFENPATDKLPTDVNDPRIFDHDGDGKPGITVSIRTGPTGSGPLGEIYIARRERFAYDVAEQSDGSLTGEVTDKSEQLIIGATSKAFVTDSEWIQYPDLTKSPIILKPVAATWDCKKLMASAKELFPFNPKVDW